MQPPTRTAWFSFSQKAVMHRCTFKPMSFIIFIICALNTVNSNDYISWYPHIHSSLFWGVQVWLLGNIFEIKCGTRCILIEWKVAESYLNCHTTWTAYNIQHPTPQPHRFHLEDCMWVIVVSYAKQYSIMDSICDIFGVTVGGKK